MDEDVDELEFEYINLDAQNPRPSTSSSTQTDLPALSDTTTLTHRRKIRRIQECASALSHPCGREKSEKINQALAEMISINMMPASFVDSIGFARFMKVVEPGYKPPSAATITNRIHLLYDEIALKIKRKLELASAVAISADNWTSRESRAQDSYLTVQARYINKDWKLLNMTLTTENMDERHSAENLAARLTNVFLEWGIEKIISGVVTDNAANIVSAVRLLDNVAEKTDISCSVHTLQLCINVGLENEDIKLICSKASSIVTYFRHSNVASEALKKMQAASNLKCSKLIQNVKTRWNSTFFMIKRLVENRVPIISVLADRNITPGSTAIKLELTQNDWDLLIALAAVLHPLQIASELLCADNSCTSVVQPIIYSLICLHLKSNIIDPPAILQLKKNISQQCTNRFNLNTNYVSPRGIASFLDPRYKNLMHIENIEIRHAIHSEIKEKLLVMELTDNDVVPNNAAPSQTAIDFLFGDATNVNDSTAQFNKYLAEPQIDRNMDPYVWWHNHSKLYPSLSKLAQQFLCIPATSAASERTFSTAGNIVNAKRSCLAPENVNMLVFLHQNKFWYEQCT